LGRGKRKRPDRFQTREIKIKSRKKGTKADKAKVLKDPKKGLRE